MIFPKSCKRYIDLQCNGDLSLYTDFPEIQRLDKYLLNLHPKRVADLGSGIGRASVYLEQRYKWGATYHLIDGDTGDTQYDGIRNKDNEFYNSHQASKDFCNANGLRFQIVNPSTDPWWKSNYDLIFSFLAFGFHWPIDMMMNKIEQAITDGTVIFGLRGLEEKKWQDDQINRLDTSVWEILQYHLAPKLERSSVLILRKK